MKLVFCLATLLIATSLCEAYSGPKNVTRRLEREVNSYFSQLENQVVSEMKNYRGAIQSNVQSYLSEYSKLRERIGRELNQVGPQGQLIARQIAADVKGMIASVKAAFNQKVIQSKAQQVLSYVKANYIDPLKADLGLLKNAVAENPSAIECWDENKAALRGIVDSVASQAKSAIDSNLNGLDVEADMLVAKIGAAVARIETQIRSTCTNSDCVVDYFGKNYTSLQAEFEGYRDEFVAAIDAAVNDTLADVNAALKDAEAKYEPLNEKVQDCAASFHLL